MRGKLLKKSIDITDNILSKFDHWTTSCVFNFLGVNYDLNGKYIRHNTKLNEVGMSVNGVNATMTFHSREFVRKNVPFVNAGGVIQLTNGAGAMITVEDEIATRVYNVCRVITDETLGIIVCELQLSNNSVIPIPTPIPTCPDFEYVIKDFAGNVLYSGTVLSGFDLDQTINNSTITNSASTVLADILAQGSITLPDVDNIDSDGSIVPTPAGVPFVATSCGVSPPATAVLKDSNGLQISTKIIASGATEDILAPNSSYEVKYQNGTLIESGVIVSNGSKSIIVPNPIMCSDATAVLKDVDGNIISTTDIPSGTTEDITAPNGTVNAIDSDSTVIGTTTVLSGGTTSIPISDSSITLNGSSFLDVKAEATQDIELVDQSDNQIVPISVVGNKIEVNIPIPNDNWVRPSDWIDISGMVTTGQQKFVGTYAVFDTESNICDLTYFYIGGGYTIDWGDGNIISYASGSNASHNYNYSDLAHYCSRGYRIAVITITPTSGGNFSDVNLRTISGTKLNWLELNMCFPSMGAGGIFAIGNGLTSSTMPLLENINIISFGAVNTLQDSFANILNLQQIIIHSNTSGVVNMRGAFQYSGLKKLPIMDTHNVTSMQLMCYNMPNLMIFEGYNTGSVITMEDCFYGCKSLNRMDDFDTTNATTYGYFAYQTPLIIFPAINLNASTINANLVLGLTSLKAFRATNIGLSLNLSNNQIERTEAVEILNNLKTVAGQTLTLTGNPCVSTLTPTDLLIGTSKGWTITL